jgi:hypothetical protein
MEAREAGCLGRSASPVNKCLGERPGVIISVSQKNSNTIVEVRCD